ncbi:MAG: DUF167 domain-containing protein [Solirubrobacterales bacterium]
MAQPAAGPAASYPSASCLSASCLSASCLSASTDGVVVAVRVSPRASRSAVEGVRDGRLLVRVTAPPADGAANKAVCKLLSNATRVPAGRVNVIRGQSARDKHVELAGADLVTVGRLLSIKS